MDVHRVSFFRGYTPFCYDGIPSFLNKIPNEIKKYLSKFNRNQCPSARKHVQAFSDLMYDFDVCHEDLWMRLFVQTLEGDEREWFSFLPIASFSSWDELISCFIDYFDGLVDVKLMLDRLMEIQIEEDELIQRFNSRFIRTLMDIPEDFRPHDQICLVIYLSAFDQKMGFLLRDKQPLSLHQAFEIAMDIECNLKYGVIRRHASTSLHIQSRGNDQEEGEQH